MPKYRYFGFATAAYPDVVIPGEGSLWVEPGDVKELDENPDPRWFIEVADPRGGIEVEPDPLNVPVPPPAKGGAIKSNPDTVTVGE